ncbi:MAG: redox-sensitive transcriptional activator SoxR [Pseudomonadota bacterium]
MPSSGTLVSDLSVGAMATRAGVPVSTLHYYESLGLISSWRTSANHRRYNRAMLRRVAIIKVAQKLGLPLENIGAALASIPDDTTPSAKDWERMSLLWRDELTARIDAMTQLRDQLGSCIGCGCLSLKHCPLYNPEDVLADEGSGPRRLDPD